MSDSWSGDDEDHSDQAEEDVPSSGSDDDSDDSDDQASKKKQKLNVKLVKQEKKRRGKDEDQYDSDDGADGADDAEDVAYSRPSMSHIKNKERNTLLLFLLSVVAVCLPFSVSFPPFTSCSECEAKAVESAIEERGQREAETIGGEARRPGASAVSNRIYGDLLVDVALRKFGSPFLRSLCQLGVVLCYRFFFFFFFFFFFVAVARVWCSFSLMRSCLFLIGAPDKEAKNTR